jgi:glycosyltransferase involved in cell wall biosynthesis
MKIKALIIIPCFNEEQNIVALLNKLEKFYLEGIEFTILPINDGSKDKTVEKIKANAKNYLNLSTNLGIGGAVQSGIKYALQNNFDYAIQMDGDGQHPPEELFKIINHAKQTNANICIGSRYIKPQGFQSTVLRRFGIKNLNYVIYITTGQKIYDCTSGYRLYDKRAIELFATNYPDKYPEPETIVYARLSGLKIAEVQVEMKERKNGVSSISGFSTLYYMVKVSLAILFLKLGFIFAEK